MTALKRIFAYGIVLSAVACGASGMINDGTAASSATLSTVTSAPTDGEANASLLDPGGQNTELCQAANAQGPGGHHGGEWGDGNGQNSNCWKTVHQYLRDEKALAQTTAFQAAVQSPNYLALCSDVSTLRQDHCNSVVAATAQCQAATQQFDTALQAFWQSSVFTTLEQTPEYQAVQQDANQLQADNCFNGNSTTGTSTGTTTRGSTTGTTSAGTTTAGATTASTTTAGTTTAGTTTSATTGTTTSVSITGGGTGNTGNGDTAGTSGTTGTTTGGTNL